MTRKKTTSKKIAGRTKSAVAGKGKKKSTRKTARKRAVKKATAKQAPVSRVQEARRGDHLPYTYDTPVGEIRKSLGAHPGMDDSMKYGDYLRKTGRHTIADILKQITEKYV